MTRQPLRGEIWFVPLPTDPPGKHERPVVIVSTDDRNMHPKANTVLVVPFSTSTLKEVPTHVYLSPGETGLELSVLKAEDITVVRKETLRESRTRLRNLSNTRICDLAEKVTIAMGCINKPRR
jgi:mRNA-degrading endonuclease toxin of MazEF toxin-antitoxin module